MATISNCLQILNAMPQQDQDAVLARLDELQAQGMPAQRAQIQAAIDVLAGLERQAARLAAIPEDQDLDPDAPDADDSSLMRSRARSPSEIFGQDIAPVAIRAYKSLSPRAKGIIDGWNVNWSMGQGKLRDNEAFDEVMAAYEPVRDKLREVYGEGIPAYRGEQQDGTESKTDRFLFSWTPMRDVATAFAINRRRGMPSAITQEQVDEQVANYRKTGIARLNGYKFARKDPGKYTPDGPDYYYIYQGAEMQTDGDDIARALQSEKSERDEYIAKLRESGTLYTANIPVDSVAFVPVNLNLSQPEFVAEYNPRKEASQEIKLSRQRSPMGFYSALARGVEDMQTKSAPAGAWKTQIKGLVNKGAVKADEIEWSGINDFLDLQEGKVSKDAVLEYLRGNGVQVEEVVLGETAKPKPFTIEEDGGVWNVLDNNQAAFPDGRVADGPFDEEWEATNRAEMLNEDLDNGEYSGWQGEVGGLTKYGQYTLPGGENYREVLLTLPSKQYRVADLKIDEAESASRDGGIFWVVNAPDQTYQIPKSKAKSRDDAIDYIIEKKRKDTGKPDYRSSHWDQPNILAHIRMNDRVDADGKRVLFIEEIQSDWGQDGKKQGFAGAMIPQNTSWEAVDTLDTLTTREEAESRMADLTQYLDRNREPGMENRLVVREVARFGTGAGQPPLWDVVEEQRSAVAEAPSRFGVPLAPFVNKTEGWLGLALKRVIGMAVDQGYERVAFITGEQSAERYDLSKKVGSITWVPNSDGTYNMEVLNLEDATILSNGSADASWLEDHIGKDLAKKIVDDQHTEILERSGRRFLSGDNLKVGGEGMKAFYDKIVPSTLKPLLKKLGGGQLGTVEIDDRAPGSEAWMNDLTDEDILRQPGFDITDDMREKVSTEGLPLFSRKRGWDGFPDAVVATPLSAQSKDSSYQAAKSGDAAAAVELVDRVLPADVASRVRAMIGNSQPIIAAVHAEESAGRNKIPLATAAALGDRLDLEVDEDIIQSTRSRRTGSDGMARIGVQPGFAGKVRAGADYLVVDDTLTQGGTLAQLKTYIEDNGGRVVGAFALGGKQYSAKISLDDKTLSDLRDKYGSIEDWWRGELGYGFSGLTESEARYILKSGLSPQAIRDRVAAARQEAGIGADEGDQADLTASRQRQTETPEFKRWSNGLPVYEDAADGENGRGVYKLYRATTKDFDEFIPGGPSPKDSGRAIWLAPTQSNTSAAFRVGNEQRGFRDGANIMPVYARLQRPLVIDDKGMLEYARAVFAEGSREFPQLISDTSRDSVLEDYDSIIFDGEALGWGKGSNEFIVFDGKQIKSAIGNSGSFDPVNPDITKSAKRQADSPAFKRWFGGSKVVDAQDQPLVVYRGEHGEGDGQPRSLLGSITFTNDAKVASTYATNPNDGERFERAESPRVIPAYLSIKKPIINTTDDPFIELAALIDGLGLKEAVRFARKHSDDIEYTSNWEERYAEKYESVGDLLDAKPRSHDKILRTLYMDAFRLLDDPEFVQAAKAAGFDGAIHAGNGESMDAIEYRVFDDSQIKSAIGNRGTFDPADPGITKSTGRLPVTVEMTSRNTATAMAGKKIVGQATAWEDSRGKFVIMNTEVRGPYRRRGIARRMYEAIEQAAGRQLTPAVSLSNDAFELWKSFRPESVAKDLRHWKDQLIGASVVKRGLPGKIIKADGGGAMMEYDEAQPGGTQSVILRGDLNEALAAGGSPTIDFDGPKPGVTKSTGRTATGASWDSPSASKFDDMVYKLQDKQIDLKRVSESIKDAAGAIADDLNVYLQEELFHGRAAKRTEDFVNLELNPLVEQMAKDKLTIADVEEYMHARHAPEANAVIAQRNPGEPGLQDGGSGMTNSAAATYMASLSPQDKTLLDSTAAKVDAIIAKTRDLYVDYELESRDTVNGWASVFQHYIPLQREDKDGAPGMGQGFSVKGKETKGRTGSTRKVVDILANVARQRERAIVRGEKDRVARALVGLAEANPNPEFWTVDEVPTERVFNPSTGLVEDRADPMYKNRPNAVVAKVMDANGQIRERAVVFNEDDPRALRLASSLKNLDTDKLEGLLGASAVVTRYFAAINTQYNPIFGAVNLVRDVQGAILNLSSTPLAGDQAKIAKTTLSALRGIYVDSRAARKGRSQNSAWAQLWDEFQSVGGQTGFRDLFRTSADRARSIQNTLDPTSWMNSKLGKIFTAGGALKVPVAQAQKGAGWIFDLLSDYNLAMENGIRLAAYKAGLERGLTKEQSASVAKNLTVNFNRKGQTSLQAGALYAFFNAAMQGTARLAETVLTMEPGKPKTIRLSPTGKKIVYGGVMLGSIQALALAAAGFGDEDPPEFARERSLIIPIGDKKYLTIPMPLGFHVIPNIGRITTEFALSGFKDPHKRAVSLLGLFADTFNPIGNAGLSMQTLAPTALDPLVALTENKDWTGKPIARESSNSAIPGHSLARDTASTMAKLLAEGVNTLSGGNKYVAGAFSPNPDQIDYLWGQVTGGVGRELSKVEQTVLATARGEDLPTYKIPLVGRFIGNAKSQASEGSTFYANAARLNEIETEVKGLRKDGKMAEAQKVLNSNSEAYLITMANQAERQVQRLRAQKRELVKAGADRQQVIAIEQQITSTMSRLNRAVESLEEKQPN